VGHPDTSFARLVSLAAHDLRTPLATISGFAQTLLRAGKLQEPNDRYMSIIVEASRQLAELLDELGLAARIVDDRFEPNLQPVDTLELARAAQEELGDDRVRVFGTGGEVRVDVDSTRRGVAALVQAALRHGGLEEVDVHAEGTTMIIRPVTEASGPVVTGADLRDLGAAVAVLLVEAMGGSVALDGPAVAVRLPR
jgi:two-component system, OmpR family, phosphate regulon sensor histidine kinase PhoR